MIRRAPEPESGFTLVETVVAFAILSIVIAGAVQVVGAGSVRARVAADRATAIGDAQSELARLAAMSRLTEGVSTGEFPDGFRWKLTTSPHGELLASEGALVPWDVELEVMRPASPSGPATMRSVILAVSPDRRP